MSAATLRAWLNRQIDEGERYQHLADMNGSTNLSNSHRVALCRTVLSLLEEPDPEPDPARDALLRARARFQREVADIDQRIAEHDRNKA